jgi:hypothetical protein
MRVLNVFEDCACFTLYVPFIEPFNAVGRALVVLGTDIERQAAILAAAGDQALRLVEFVSL